MNAQRIAIGALGLALGLTMAIPVTAQDKGAKLEFQPDPALPKSSAPDPSKLETGIPVVQKKDLIETPPVLAPQDLSASDLFHGRLSVRADVGDGVGYTRGYTYLEGMIPLRQCDQTLLFADVRIVNFDQENRWEYNLGGGYRWYSPRVEHVLGVNAFYDARKTDFHYYQQLGAGIEALGRTLEFRCNGYVIVGAAHRVVGDTGVVGLGVIAANNFIFQRVQNIEAALGGVDAEVGGRLPILERYALRGYVGFYSYSASEIGVANGVRGRLEAQLSDRISLHFAVQRDQIFQTTVSGGLAIHFGAPPYRRGTCARTWDDVLRQPVRRDVNVVIATTTTTDTLFQPVPPPPPPPPPRIILPD